MSKTLHTFTVFLFCLFSANNALCSEALLENPILENTARNLFREIKCPVCEGQAIGDSSAELASDMRSIIRDKLKSGMNEAEIKIFLTKRYGKDILFDPPYETSTFILWYTPFALLLLGVIRLFKKR
jgi:cytochrome c-type biogenesis protein CcmH